MIIAVCDDESYIHREIRKLIADYVAPDDMFDWEPLSFNDGTELIEYIKKGKTIDLLFLDVEMERSNGIDVANQLRRMTENMIIIFVSSHKNYVFDAFQCEALHFLVKPVKKQDFNDVFNRAIHRNNQRNCLLPLKFQNERACVNVQDVLYVESLRKHLLIHTKTEDFDIIGNLKDIYAFLKPHGFVKIHHGYVVNMAHIKRFAGDCVHLINGEQVQMSMRKRSEALATYDAFLQKWKW